MKNREVSLRGKLVRDMMKNMMDSAMGHKIQTGEYRMDPKEPAWICPPDYEYEIVGMEHFKMEYLRPAGVCTGRVILQLHGGGYIGPMKNIYRDFAIQYCRRSFGGDVLTVDYRVAPEHPYPAALEDAVAAYQWLIGEKHYEADKIVIAGDSAGGGLALALVMYLRDHGMDLPAGVLVMSPWTDLTGEGKTFQTKAELDPVLDKEYIDRMTRAYAPDRDLTDPYISPLFGDFHGFPPVYIQVGENEILLDDSLRLYKNLIKAGVAANIDRFPGMWHVFQMSPFKKASEAMDKNAEFIYSVCR